MWARLIGGFVALAIAIAVIVPLGRMPSVPQTLRLAIPDQPQTLDPALSRLPGEATIGRQVTTTLLGPSPDLEGVRPLAARDYSVSPDGLTYTFHLRPGMAYATGHPVVAQDYVFAWTRLIDPRVGSPWSGLFASAVKGGHDLAQLDPKQEADKIPGAIAALGLAAPDPLTFVVTLAQPMASFRWLATLWAGVALPSGAWTDRAGAINPSLAAQVMFDGPYRVSRVVPGHEIDLVRNPGYAGPDRPSLTAIHVRTGMSSSQALAAYRRGGLDAVGLPGARAVPGVPKAQTHPEPGLATYWVTFNLRHPPFDNPAVRQAFAAAVDPASLPGVTGVGNPVTMIVPRGLGLPQPPRLVGSTDARAALTTAGIDPASLSTSTIIVDGQSPASQAIAAALADQWRAHLGVTVRVASFTGDDLQRHLHAGDFDMQALGGWQVEYPDPQDLFDAFLGDNPANLGGYHSSAYDDLVSRADQDSGAGRTDLYARAAAQLQSDAPVLPVYQPVESWLIQPWVAGWRLSPLDDEGFPSSVFGRNLHLVRH